MPLYRVKSGQNQTQKKWNVQKVTRPFFFFFVQKGEEKIGGVVRHDDDSNQPTKRQKKWVGGGESDSAFKDKHTMHLMETGAGLVT